MSGDITALERRAREVIEVRMAWQSVDDELTRLLRRAKTAAKAEDVLSCPPPSDPGLVELAADLERRKVAARRYLDAVALIEEEDELRAVWPYTGSF